MSKYSGLELLTAKFWAAHPYIWKVELARRWIERFASLGNPDTTIIAYANDLEVLLSWCASQRVAPERLDGHGAERYVEHLGKMRSKRRSKVVFFGDAVVRAARRPALSAKTKNRRLSVARRWFNYLMAHEVRTTNPFVEAYLGQDGEVVENLRFRSEHLFSKWIPDDAEWFRILTTVNSPFFTVRDRLMLHFEYDCALRISELCGIQLDHIHFGEGKKANYLYIPPGKNKLERRVPFTEKVVAALVAYLEHRTTVTLARGSLFVSESRRNYGVGVSVETWQKRIQEIRRRSGLPRLTSHTMRHLCLTDLARGGMDALYIKSFAGHKSLRSTQEYLHLALSDLTKSFGTSMAGVREWRSGTFLESEQADAS